MDEMFYEAVAFNQALGWCLDDDVDTGGSFIFALCQSTNCGVITQGSCAPTPAPIDAPTPGPSCTPPTPEPTPRPHSDDATTAGASLLLLAAAAALALA